MSENNQIKLTLGSNLFNWEAERWRDFYYNIADECDVDVVYVGESVCYKRVPFFKPYFEDVIKRLQSGGKETIFSTLALVMDKKDRNIMNDASNFGADMVEANDIGALEAIGDNKHVIGSYINTYHEDTAEFFINQGASRICLPPELSFDSVSNITKASNGLGADIEIVTYGRVGLALSARCYHARMNNLSKDNCKFVCNQDDDGLGVDTMDGENFLAINGIQTMSYGCLDLSSHVQSLIDIGVKYFRLSPHSCDMIAVAKVYRELINGTIDANEASARIIAINKDAGFKAPLIDGFIKGIEGASFDGKINL